MLSSSISSENDFRRLGYEQTQNDIAILQVARHVLIGCEIAKDGVGALPDEFPLADVHAALEAWWESEKSDSAFPGDGAPDNDAGIMRSAVEIDSHRAVRALITLEEIVKFAIPESQIKEGGYDGFEEMRDHLVPRVLALYENKRKKEHA